MSGGRAKLCDVRDGVKLDGDAIPTPYIIADAVYEYTKKPTSSLPELFWPLKRSVLAIHGLKDSPVENVPPMKTFLVLVDKVYEVLKDKTNNLWVRINMLGVGMELVVGTGCLLVWGGFVITSWGGSWGGMGGDNEFRSHGCHSTFIRTTYNFRNVSQALVRKVLEACTIFFATDLDEADVVVAENSEEAMVPKTQTLAE